MPSVVSHTVRAVFFDRDGTLMEDVDYCNDPEQVFVYPGVRAALSRLKARGFKNIIITNQSGIGRGLITPEQYQRVHEALLAQIGAENIDGTYFCPDTPSQPSTRRKPMPGMVFEAAREHGILLGQSFFIGDKPADILCGKNAGTRSVLVETGYGKTYAGEKPDFVAKDVVAAVDLILRNTDA
jgi:D-glycero-D-manno-heptose 1,7-bisphosphate phosphatase